MAKRKGQWVVQRDNVWAVRGEGNSKDTVHKPTQREAEAVAKGIARNQRSEVIIQGRDGKIRKKTSYGNDPHPPKG